MYDATGTKRQVEDRVGAGAAGRLRGRGAGRGEADAGRARAGREELRLIGMEGRREPVAEDREQRADRDDDRLGENDFEIAAIPISFLSNSHLEI